MFQCIAKVMVPQYALKKTKVCGVDYKKGQMVNEELGLDIASLMTIDGAHRAECSTCDDIDLKTGAQVQEKYFCLLGNYLKLQSDSSMSNDKLLMMAELKAVMAVFLDTYEPVLSSGQIQGMQQVLMEQSQTR